MPAAAPARRIVASSAAALDTGHLPRGHSTPAAAPLPPLTLVPRPSPPSYAPPPPSPSATTANVAVTVRPTWRRRKAARYAGGTRHLNAQGPYLTTIETLPSTTAGWPPPSPCLPPPPPGSPRRVRPTSTTTGLTPPFPCPPPPPQGSLADPFDKHRGAAPAVSPPRTVTSSSRSGCFHENRQKHWCDGLGEQGVLLRISCRNRLCCRIEQGTRLAHQVALVSI